MIVWLVLEGYTDGYTYCADEVYSVHLSEEGAYLAQVELERLQGLPYPERNSDRGSSVSIREHEVLP
ncbi:MAG: hypothetical protein RL662_153 [Bacteroidota bacterium]|jgi:hypothetical protein